MSEETQTAAAATEPTQNQAPDLTVQDLNALKAIIDVASQRGAFKPNEMTVVGTTYTKLENFLNAVASAAAEQQGSETTEETPTEA